MNEGTYIPFSGRRKPLSLLDNSVLVVSSVIGLLVGATAGDVNCRRDGDRDEASQSDGEKKARKRNSTCIGTLMLGTLLAS